MLPHKPEDWPRLFEQQLNAGDLEAVVALYEPNASFVPKSGKTVVGHDGIRLMLAELKRTTLQVRTKNWASLVRGKVDISTRADK